MRSTALDVEKGWRDALGEHRFGELRETLLALLSAETREAPGLGVPAPRI
jgi:hypothetical protein